MLQKFKYNFKHQSVIISKLIIVFVYWENIITCFHSAREEEIFYLKIETPIISIITAYFTFFFYLRQTFSSLPNPENVWGGSVTLEQQCFCWACWILAFSVDYAVQVASPREEQFGEKFISFIVKHENAIM